MSTRYRIDPRRSQVSAATRPALGDGPLEATITGVVEVGDDRLVSGVLRIEIPAAGSGAGVTLEVDAVATRAELDRGPDGEVLLRGSITRPAGDVGRLGPPLLNPTVVFRWRAVLVSDD